jgi:hypothetical protein
MRRLPPGCNPCTGCTWKIVQLNLTHSAPFFIVRKSCCRGNVTSAGRWVILYTLLITANTCMRHSSICFLQIAMHCFKHTSVRLSPIRISTMVFPQCSEKISIALTVHKMHVCKFHVSKSGHFFLVTCTTVRV